MRPSVTCTTTTACATRSTYQNHTDGSFRAHATAPHTPANKLIGPKRPGQVKTEPYECGLPSEVTRNFRFGVSFYLVAMLFILFDVEVIFLYPVAVLLKSVGTF